MKLHSPLLLLFYPFFLIHWIKIISRLLFFDSLFSRDTKYTALTSFLNFRSASSADRFILRHSPTTLIFNASVIIWSVGWDSSIVVRSLFWWTAKGTVTILLKTTVEPTMTAHLTGQCTMYSHVYTNAYKSLFVVFFFGGSSLGWGHCIVFFGKRLHSHNASLHPGI